MIDYKTVTLDDFIKKLPFEDRIKINELAAKHLEEAQDAGPDNLVEISSHKRYKRIRRGVMQSLDEVKKQVRANKLRYVETVLENLMKSVMDRLTETGYVIETPENAKDCSLVMEGLRAAWFRKVGLHHDLHHIADKYFMANRKTVAFLGKKDTLSADDMKYINQSDPPDITA